MPSHWMLINFKRKRISDGIKQKLISKSHLKKSLNGFIKSLVSVPNVLKRRNWNEKLKWNFFELETNWINVDLEKGWIVADI